MPLSRTSQVKILELTIENIRGLPNLTLRPDGGNLVIWGPNGSGKSGVVDAIDFLLSGRISRLAGRGTGGITLARHGPHIDSAPDRARVRALVKLPNHNDPVEIERCFTSPEHLQCPEEVSADLRDIEGLAKRGQHILTRREILRFITTEPGNRAQDIQQLLNLSDVESLRSSLVTTANRLRDERSSAENTVREQRNSIASLVQMAAYDEAELVRIINENRRTLGGTDINELKADILRQGLNAPVAIADSNVNPSLVIQDITHCRHFLSEETASEVRQMDGDLRALLETARRTPDMASDMAHLELVEQGYLLLDGSGRCPLCDKEWEPDALRRHLEEKRERGTQAREQSSRIQSQARRLKDPVDNLLATLRRVESAVAPSEPQWGGTIASWSRDLEGLAEALRRPMEMYVQQQNLVAQMLAPPGADVALERMLRTVGSQPQVSPEQTAWDLLTRLGDRVSDLENGVAWLAKSERAAQRGETLLRAFEEARDRILQELYEQVKDRFVEFYKMLHDHEAEHFEATLAPRHAGLEFQVDFLGRGRHPPHALHSEGHQDSMGLCLFLALAEKLSARQLDLIVLDDVVMSVDADHRRDICRLLTDPFPDKQFILTTHDRTWAMQLRSAAFVEGRNLIEFVRWSVDTGPLVGQLDGIWERIEEALERGDVHDAAGRLRRGSEQYFEAVCDALRAPVPYRSDGRWDLGTWLPAAMSKYGRLLREARNTAQAWSNVEGLARFEELDSVKSQVFRRSQVEQWSLNPHIHYTSWANLSAGEFRPLIEAYQDLFAVFTCSSCQQLLQLVEPAGQEVSVKCRCGGVNWNLERP